MLDSLATATMTDWNAVRRDFPVVERPTQDGKQLVYLDSACQSLRPKQVIEMLSYYYNELGTCASSNPSAHALAKETEAHLETARGKMAKLIGARNQEIVWQPNTTYGLNLVAASLTTSSCPSEIRLDSDDNIVTTDVEQHSGLLPYWLVGQEKRVRLRIFRTDSNGVVDLQTFQDFLTRKTKLISIVWASNVTGSIAPIDEMAKIAHDNHSLLVVDGAQYVPHHPINVKTLDIDFLAFSVHKMCGPTGTGVLYGKESLLAQMPPIIVGGETVNDVSIDSNGLLIPTFRTSPGKFEPGLQNFAGIMGSGAAVDYLVNRVGLDSIEARERSLTGLLLRKLNDIPDVQILGPSSPEQQRAPLAAFRFRKRYGDYFPGLAITSHMDHNVKGYEILLGAGGFEALPYLQKNRISPLSTVRASLSFYNNAEEIEIFAGELENLRSKSSTTATRGV